MKTEAQIRLECLKGALTLAASKQIPPKDVIPYAMEFFRWVNGSGGSALDVDEPVSRPHLEQLRDRFAR